MDGDDDSGDGEGGGGDGGEGGGVCVLEGVVGCCHCGLGLLRVRVVVLMSELGSQRVSRVWLKMAMTRSRECDLGR